MIYGFLNQKGGVGKTTVSINHSMELARRGRRVLHIDVDPQESSLDWYSERLANGLKPLINVIGYAKPTIRDAIASHIDHYDDIVLDGPARIEDLGRAAVLACDLVVIPIQPSGLDAWATAKILDILDTSKVYRPDLAAVFVINRRIVGTKISTEMKKGLKDIGPRLMEATISQRVSYAESMGEGKAIWEYDPGSAAAEEFRALSMELEEYLISELQAQGSLESTSETKEPQPAGE
ncbi:ParA family partition ATPase [Mycobacteroides abscessus]|uniref:ParA family partition ATPase n=1 Tax=Mycobacteroides abscessus TaxID=36809 RepID=UPI002106E059|nr:ParA family partition ATPase [Mycobacteroides abscessus]